jgi:hypothetical protein
MALATHIADHDVGHPSIVSGIFGSTSIVSFGQCCGYFNFIGRFLDNVARFIPLQFMGLLVVGMAGILAVIQWNYQIQQRKKIVDSKHDFRKSRDECLDTMDSLKLRISMTRYAALLLVIGSWFFLSSRHDDSVVDNTKGGVVVTSSVELK